MHLSLYPLSSITCFRLGGPRQGNLQVKGGSFPAEIRGKRPVPCTSQLARGYALNEVAVYKYGSSQSDAKSGNSSFEEGKSLQHTLPHIDAEVRFTDDIQRTSHMNSLCTCTHFCLQYDSIGNGPLKPRQAANLKEGPPSRPKFCWGWIRRSRSLLFFFAPAL